MLQRIGKDDSQVEEKKAKGKRKKKKKKAKRDKENSDRKELGGTGITFDSLWQFLF